MERLYYNTIASAAGSLLARCRGMRRSTGQRIREIRGKKRNDENGKNDDERKARANLTVDCCMIKKKMFRPSRIVEHGAVAAASCDTVEGTARTAAVAEPRRRVRGPGSGGGPS